MPPGRRPTPSRPRGATGFQQPKRTSPTDAYGQRYAAQAAMYGTPQNQANMAEYSNAGGPAAAADPWNDMTPDQYFAALMGAGGVNGAGGGGSGGGGGGGGSAKPGDPDPLGWNAIAMGEATNKGYSEMLAALDAKNAALSGGFDARNTALNAANTAGQQKLAQLLSGVQAQASQTAQNVAGTYGAGDQQLQGLMSEYAQMAAARQPAMGNTLQAFGANPAGAVSNGNQVQDLLTAQRSNMARMGQADQALLAGRSNVYNGLNNDVTTQRQQGFDALMAKLLAERQATEASGASERAQLAMAQQQALLQQQAQEQARRASYG